MDTSGLTGSPGANMFSFACSGMSGIQGGNITLGAGITFTDANVVGTLSYMMYNSSGWTGQLYWGANVIHTVLTPTSDINTFAGCTSMPGYAGLAANWK
jgi:hypothetical protein